VAIKKSTVRSTMMRNEAGLLMSWRCSVESAKNCEGTNSELKAADTVFLWIARPKESVPEGNQFTGTLHSRLPRCSDSTSRGRDITAKAKMRRDAPSNSP
jgi:hypothetical protein